MIRRRRTIFYRLLITGGFACVVAITCLLLQTSRHREGARADPCAHQMRQIALEACLYAREHEGRYPPSLRELYLWSRHLSGDLFVCRRSLATPLMSKNRVEVADQLSDRRHASYIYCGDGLQLSDPADAGDIIILVDPPEHHEGGMFAMFADANVEWFANEGPLIMEQIRSGVRPVRRPPTSQPASR